MLVRESNKVDVCMFLEDRGVTLVEYNNNNIPVTPSIAIDSGNLGNVL